MPRLTMLVLLLVGCGSSGSSAWTEQAVPTPGALTAYTLWVSGDDDVWLGGSSLWHFDGSTWTETPPSPASPILHFWGFTPTDVWAIGDAHVFHYDGASWTEVPPTAGITFEAMWRIWGSSGTDIWIANQDNSRVYHYDGATWTRTTLQFVMVDALWGSSPSDIWLSGVGDLYHFTTSWERYDGNDAPPLVNAFWGFAPNDVWAAGTFDALSHWDGAAWTPDESQDDSYNGLWGSAPNNLYAVGDNGMVAHFNGSSWSSSHELNVRTSFTMVHGSSPDNIWATAVDLGAQKALVLRYQP